MTVDNPDHQSVDGAIDGLKPAEAAVTGEAAAVTPMST
jgi:hypothetical protein